jgi:uncharacterized membrane protein (Fun14 family)
LRHYIIQLDESVSKGSILGNLTGFSLACFHRIVQPDERVGRGWILGNLTGFSRSFVHRIVHLDEGVSGGVDCHPFPSYLHARGVRNINAISKKRSARKSKEAEFSKQCNFQRPHS